MEKEASYFATYKRFSKEVPYFLFLLSFSLASKTLSSKFDVRDIANRKGEQYSKCSRT